MRIRCFAEGTYFPKTVKRGDEGMRLHELIPRPGVRAAIGTLMFFIAWLSGAVSMRAGFEVEADLPAACLFAIACGLWWVAYKFSRSANGRGMIIGFAGVALWMLYLLSGLVFNFHETTSHLFFWLSFAMLLTLVAMVAISDKSSGDPRVSPTRD